MLASALLSVPATLMLWPLWSWIEATFGIEAVGHSGPADWCFWATFAVMAVALVAGRLAWRARHS